MMDSPEVSIFNLSSIVLCGDVELSAWCQNGRTQLLALYLRRGEFLLSLLTDAKPIIRRVPWYKDPVHRPVALSFSPAGSFLLVLSESCHLYTVPAMCLLDPNFKTDVALDTTDITLIAYPFKNGPESRQGSVNNLNADSSEVASKLKDITGKKTEQIGTAVSWYQTLEECQQLGVIGTKGGHLILVDLMTGVRHLTTSVSAEIRSLTICLDNALETVFLLISSIDQQYRLTLEQRLGSCAPSSGKRRSRGGSSEEGDEEPPRNYRARLQGLKQMSVEKLASIKMKIAESRARAQPKIVTEDPGTKPLLASVPEPLDAALRDTKVSLQYSRGRYTLSGYHAPSQLLTVSQHIMYQVHTTLYEGNPLFVHKMPPGTGECLLSDRIVYVITQDRTQVLAVSSHLSESRIERDSEFNPESVLGRFNIGIGSEKKEKEFVKAIYIGYAPVTPVNLPLEWRVDGLDKLLDESGGVETCIVVTTRQVLKISLTDNVISTVLRLILDQHALLQAERLCKIFGLHLSKVLELAGDIDMTRSKFSSAIARFKLASCGPLRIAVKFARLGHCSELLSYSTALLTSATANLNFTDHIHISNLLVMSFVHQILTSGATHLKSKFLSFLEHNDYFNKELGMDVTAHALLFPAVHKLITVRGLIVNGLSVLTTLISNFNSAPSLLSAAQDEEMWMCLSEPSLQEAFVHRQELFLTFASFLSANLNHLSLVVLERFCRALDPSSPALRPIVRLRSEDEAETFPLSKLIHLFLIALLIRLSKDRLVYDQTLMLPEEEQEEERERSPKRGDEDDEEQIWAIRKERRDSITEQCCNQVLSCGFGHSALIRNGTVITWGLSNKGCLGHGPALARHSPPEPISWFGCFRLQVTHVSCGSAHTVALTNNGVYAWGSSQFGQLGMDSLHESPHPRLVTTLSHHRVVAAECGQYHTLYLTSSGSVLACGWNVHGQLGLGSIENMRVPVVVQTLKEHVVLAIAAGHGHSLVLTDLGHVYSFGFCLFGQLGNGGVAKSSSPVLVKGINGRVEKIATGYFHNLALTRSNALYCWGASPQVLRLQGQALKRARAVQMPTAGADATPDVADSEAHLKPTLVDTRNVAGKITQIACGCHHYALVTDNGSLYTWGRSMDGQLGNGSRSEVVIPALVQDGSLKVSSVALGCDFSVAVEKHSAKVYAWGSNGYGQVGIPIKDTAAKTTDGTIIVVKSVKRVVRLPNSVANLIGIPNEVPSIPSATFTYQSLTGSLAMPVHIPSESYTAEIWHRTLQKFLSLINPELLLCKCLELGNHQAASKLLLLQGQIRQALVHQLKALQKAQKQRGRSRDLEDLEEKNDQNEERSRKVVQTPEAEIHPFTVQGGLEGLCDMETPLTGFHNSLEKSSTNQDVDQSLMDYTNTAEQILLKFLIHSPHCAADILETGIQFWTAQKLPMAVLESFLLRHLEQIFYPLGCLLYLGKRELARHFSSDLQLRVTSRLVAHVEQNGNCGEFLTVLSKLLSCDGEPTVADLSVKLQNPTKKNIHVTWPQCPGDNIYVFSCGHTKTRILLPSGQDKLAEAYARLDTEGPVDMACPDCVCTILPAQVV